MNKLKIDATNFSEWLLTTKLPCKVILSEDTCAVYTVENVFHLLSTRFAYDSDVEKSINLFNEFLTEYNKLKQQVNDVSLFIHEYNIGKHHNSEWISHLVLLILKYKSVLSVVLNNDSIHDSKEVLSSNWMIQNNELKGTIYLHPLFEKMVKNPSKIIESEVYNLVRIAGLGSITHDLVHTVRHYVLRNFAERVDSDSYLRSLIFGVEFVNAGVFNITIGAPDSVHYSVITDFLPQKKVDPRKVLITVTGLNAAIPLAELSKNAKESCNFVENPNGNFIFSINTFTPHTAHSFSYVKEQLKREQILPNNGFLNLKQSTHDEDAYTYILRLIAQSYMTEPVIKPLTKAEAVIKSGEIVKQLTIETDNKKIIELVNELHKLHKILAGD